MQKGHATTHGMRKTRFYSIWTNMKTRCYNKKVRSFVDYGKKGIKVEWKSFEYFRDDMYKSYQAHCEQFGEKDTQINRINNDKNYCKENCNWVTIKEQARNKKTSIIINGKPLKDISAELGIKYLTLFMRLKRRGTIYI